LNEESPTTTTANHSAIKGPWCEERETTTWGISGEWNERINIEDNGAAKASTNPTVGGGGGVN